VPAEVTVAWAVLGLTGPINIRDVWRHKDLGSANSSYTANVPRHGVVMLRLSKADGGGSQ